jgi:D-alanyl-D-alanine carboxypeptidase
LKAGRFCAIALLGSLLLVAAPAQSSAAGTGKAFRSSLKRIMKAPDGPPGIAVVIVRDGKRQFFWRGKGNVRTNTAPKMRRPIRIASVAKAYSGAVALSLVDRGKLKLSDTIGHLLPGLLPKAGKVDLGQLLQHTSGLADYIKDEAFLKKLGADPAQYMTPRRILSFVKDKELKFRPGSRYKYSDSDNLVIGLMAEKVTGASYEKLLRRVIGRRIKMQRTSMPRTIAMPTPFLHGYNVEKGQSPQDISEFLNPALAWASGGIVSTLPDLSRFFRGYVGGKLFGGQVIRAQRDWISGSSQPPGPGVNSAGMGLYRYRSKCGTVYGHTGSFPGYRIFAASSADGSRSIAYVANAQIVPPDNGSQQISALIRRSQVAAVCHALG